MQEYLFIYFFILQRRHPWWGQCLKALTICKTSLIDEDIVHYQYESIGIKKISSTE